MGRYKIGDYVKKDGILYRVTNFYKPTQFEWNIYEIQNTITAEKIEVTSVEVEPVDMSWMTTTFEQELIEDDAIFTAMQEDYIPAIIPDKENRFYKPSSDEIDAMKRNRQSRGTDTQTKWAVKVFRDWLHAVGYGLEFERNPISLLAHQLEEFYTSVKTTTNKQYSKSAFKNLRAGVQRHLQSPPWSVSYNICRDAEFRQANAAYEGYLAKLRAEGNDVSTHKPLIEKEDINKLHERVFDDTPTGLQRKVFFDVLLHFGRRGREGLRSLKKDSFLIGNDASGHEYVTMAFNEKEKTRKGINDDEEDTCKTTYATPQCPDRCPVLSFKKYLSKLNPANDFFYQRPRKVFKPDDDVWYDNMVLGINHLYNMMKNMSRDGNLSKIYTNHSVRRTVVTTLDRAGYEASKIQTVTGHKNPSSLKAYLGGASLDQKRQMSNVLTMYGSTSTKVEKTVTSDVVVMDQSDELLAATQGYVHVSSSISKEEVVKSLFAGGTVLNNCTFNIHFHGNQE